MKTLNKTILVLMAVIAVSLTSCKKDDDGGGGGSAADGTVSAKIDGSSFNSMKMTSFATLASGTLVLQGSEASGKAISIIMNNYDGVGTYEFTDSNVFLVGTYIEADINNPTNSQTWTAPYEGSGVAGEIKISEKTETHIKGTFSFNAKNSNGDKSMKKITEGSFNLKFQ